MKTRSAKNKGMKLQKWVASQICKLFNLEFDNRLDDSYIQSRTCGLSGTDIILRGYVKDKFPYAIECKNTETVSLYKFIEQAKQNTSDNEKWMVVHKKNRSEPIVIISADHFFELQSKILKRDC